MRGLMNKKHDYIMGCICYSCTDYRRVADGMRHRREKYGSWYIKHNGILETRYPEAMLKWLNRRRR